MKTVPVLHRIKGSASFRQVIPKMMSTPFNRLLTVRFVFMLEPDVMMGTSTAHPRDNTFFPSPSSRKVLCDSTVSPHCITPAGEMKFRIAPLLIRCADFMTENPCWYNLNDAILFIPRIYGLVISRDNAQLILQLLWRCIARNLLVVTPIHDSVLPLVGLTKDSKRLVM